SRTFRELPRLWLKSLRARSLGCETLSFPTQVRMPQATHPEVSTGGALNAMHLGTETHWSGCFLGDSRPLRRSMRSAAVLGRPVSRLVLSVPGPSIKYG